jgi:hypothetical protein
MNTIQRVSINTHKTMNFTIYNNINNSRYKGLTKRTLSQIELFKLDRIFSHVFHVLMGLLHTDSTYSRVPGDQGGLFFSHLAFFLALVFVQIESLQFVAYCLTIRSVLQEPQSNQGPKVLLLDFYLLVTYELETSYFLVEVRGNWYLPYFPK